MSDTTETRRQTTIPWLRLFIYAGLGLLALLIGAQASFLAALPAPFETEMSLPTLWHVFTSRVSANFTIAAFLASAAVSFGFEHTPTSAIALVRRALAVFRSPDNRPRIALIAAGLFFLPLLVAAHEIFLMLAALVVLVLLTAFATMWLRQIGVPSWVPVFFTPLVLGFTTCYLFDALAYTPDFECKPGTAIALKSGENIVCKQFFYLTGKKLVLFESADGFRLVRPSDIEPGSFTAATGRMGIYF